MQETKYIWQNGTVKPWAEATVHVLSHTLHYGGGAFEGIRFYESVQGSAIFKLDEHIDRLYYSTKAIGMKLPFTHTQIHEAIVDLVKMNDLTHGYIRPLAYYGYGNLGVSSHGNPVELAIACWPWGAYLAHDRVDVKTSKYIRVHPDSTVPDAKLCGHYLNGQMASMEIINTHYHEVLLLDANGFVAEGAGENLFIVKDGALYTPTLGTILAGITRETVIDFARHNDYTVTEKQMTLDDVYSADEAFFTGTAAEITPLRSLDDKVIGKDEVGPVTAFVKQKYADIVRGKCFEYMDGLTIVY